MHKLRVPFTVLVFAIVYCLISLVNHYLFRTYALDLGAYTNALYDYAHFQWNDSGVFKSINENLLADHFDLYLILFSPLSLLFKTYTLLIVQILFMLLGGMGVYKYFSITSKGIQVGFSAMVYFFCFFGIFSALSFDYHSNVIAACVVPWFFYFLVSRKFLKTFLVMIFIIISKENVSIWMAFICLGLVFQYRKEPVIRKFLIAGFFVNIIYFLVITKVVMPWISNDGIYPHFHYSAMGENYTQFFSHLITHPIDSIIIMFTNHMNDPFGDFVKLELFLFLIVCGLPLLFRKPQYLIMLIPVFFQKLFHDNVNMWGVYNQYSVEFAPILALGVFSVVQELKKNKSVRIISISLAVLSFLCTIRLMDKTVLHTDKSKIRVYKSIHYSRNYDTKTVRNRLNKIPRNAIVSAQSSFLAQLAYRDNIYQFPMIKDAEFIVFSSHENTYPLKEDEFKTAIESISSSEQWSLDYEYQGFFVYRRK